MKIKYAQIDLDEDRVYTKEVSLADLLGFFNCDYPHRFVEGVLGLPLLELVLLRENAENEMIARALSLTKADFYIVIKDGQCSAPRKAKVEDLCYGFFYDITPDAQVKSYGGVYRLKDKTFKGSLLQKRDTLDWSTKKIIHRNSRTILAVRNVSEYVTLSSNYDRPPAIDESLLIIQDEKVRYGSIKGIRYHLKD